MAPPSFVQEHVPSHAALLARPHVTLTWAQSLDSKIAGLGGKRVVLSGPESMLMTHQSVLPPRSLQLAHPPPPQPQSHPRRHPRRRTHPPPRRPPPTKYTPSLTPASSIDASLANLLPPSHASPPPQPLILDPSLRFPLTSRILNEWNTKPALRGRTLKQPWILCGSNVSSDRINEVQQAGARVVPVPLDSNGASNAKRGLTKTDLSFHDTMIDLFEQVASLHRPFLPS